MDKLDPTDVSCIGKKTEYHIHMYSHAISNEYFKPFKGNSKVYFFFISWGPPPPQTSLINLLQNQHLN